MKRWAGVLLISVLAVLMGLGCTTEAEEIPGEIPQMDQEQAYENWQIDKTVVLLDVRTEPEYQEVHIPGSVLIPVEELRQRAPEELVDRDATIYVICRSGRRSQDGVRILQELGYTDVTDIGGIITWPFETVEGG